MACVLIINGHPDPAIERFGAALARAYRRGAEAGGHEVRTITLGELEFPLIRSADAFNAETAPPAIQAAQADITWAEHVVIVFPLWLGGLPALTKGFFEQVFRPWFAMRWSEGRFPKGLLEGKSVRLIVTMGMPATAYKLLFGASGVRSFERSVLRLVGLYRTGTTMIGGVAALSEETAKTHLDEVEALGRDAN
jgi:putative NADPH-quinone reductase